MLEGISYNVARAGIALSAVSGAELAGTLFIDGSLFHDDTQFRMQTLEPFEPIYEKLPKNWQEALRRVNEAAIPDTEVQKREEDFRELTQAEEAELRAEYREAPVILHAEKEVPEEDLFLGTFTLRDDRTVFVTLSGKKQKECKDEPHYMGDTPWEMGEEQIPPELHVLRVKIDDSDTYQQDIPVIESGNCIQDVRFQISGVPEGIHSIRLFEAAASTDQSDQEPIEKRDIKVRLSIPNDSTLAGILTHAPIIARRPDTIKNPYNDMPLADYVEVRVSRDEGEDSSLGSRRSLLKYYRVHSGEDGGSSPQQLERTKRRPWDTDWTMEEVIDLPTGEVPFGPDIQSYLHGHATINPDKHGIQPVLQTCTDNNMLCDEIDTTFHGEAIEPEYTSFVPVLVGPDDSVEELSHENDEFWTSLSFIDALHSGRVRRQEYAKFRLNQDLSFKG